MQLFTIRPAVRAALVLAAAHAAAASAAPPSSSAYATDPQSSHVEDATSRGIGQVNMIACFMAAMKPDALVNDGPYNALVDETKCDSEGRSSSANSAGGTEGAQAAAYITATVDSTRASNSDPMIAKVWVDEDEEGTIFARLSATQPPSETNPYGQFRLDFCGKGGPFPDCMMRGYLEATETGLSFYENEGGGPEGHMVALRLSTTGTGSGSGRMQMDDWSGQSEFDFAYHSSLFHRSDGTTDQCFSRDASDPDTGFSVWRYGLYNAETGARIARNSGFPIEYTVDSHVYHGYLGYWGLSLPPEARDLLESGDTVRKVDYSGGQSPTRTSYTVLKADGKLFKYTKKTRTLRAMDKIRFTTFVGDDASLFFPGAVANTQYELYWNDATATFIVTAQMNCGTNGCQTVDLESPQTVSASYWTQHGGGVQGWSQSLGGEVFIDLHDASNPIDSLATPVVYREQDLVYPSDMPTTLFCLQNCPTASSMASYFASGSSAESPYESTTFNNWSPTPGTAVVTYSMDPASATLRDGAGQAVTFTDAEAYRQRPQHQWGVRSGRLFTTLASAECDAGSSTYCDWKTNALEVYYQWETGPNDWNQFAAVKDASGNFVTFDAPLHVTYAVPSGAAYGQYAGKSIVLQYGGFGDLWGIPGNCVSRDSNEPVSCETVGARYVPSFVIPFDETDGRVTTDDGTVYLVKWLEREIRFARKDSSICAAAGLNLPNGVMLPTSADLKDPSDPGSDIYIGAKPTVTSAPRVIHGEVKY
jgi:hypothetical protein